LLAMPSDISGEFGSIVVAKLRTERIVRVKDVARVELGQQDSARSAG